ncbi:AgrD family cyclic lactone autoinducer peptide [Enterococcus sp. LJL99]
MMKKFYKTKVKLLRVTVTLGVLLGNIALASACPMGFYEPTKPDILKSEE